jgi:hypothetical protein
VIDSQVGESRQHGVPGLDTSREGQDGEQLPERPGRVELAEGEPAAEIGQFARISSTLEIQSF